MHLKFLFTYLHEILFIIKKILPWYSKKFAPVLFCVFQTELNKADHIFCRLLEWIGNIQMIPGFSTRPGWERGWKS